MFDAIIIGGGVIGAMCARELTRYCVKVAVAEAADDVCAGASRANSGIVHAGFDAPYGSLKAKFNVEGNRKMPKVCEELGVRYRNNGSLVVAHGEEEEQKLRELLERGLKNGVTGLEILDKTALTKIEPNLADDVTSALYAPTGGIVCPFQLTIAAIGNAMDNGAELFTSFSVRAAKKTQAGWKICAEDGRELEAKIILNCAGYGTAEIARLFGDDSFEIAARKGEYMLLDKSCAAFVRHTVFGLPTAAGKGVLVSPTADGNILVGPTSVEEDTYDTSTRREGFVQIREKAETMMKNIPFREVITSFAGVRAYSNRHDFIVGESEVAEGVFHAAGIESPGLTASPAIGSFLAEKIAERLNAKLNPHFDPKRKSAEWFKELDAEAQNRIIQKDPAFGRIICRCEEVTLGEILQALRQNPKAHTIDGVKLRTRAGMGRCQGGFCQPSVFNLTMKEYGYRAEEVTKNGGKSFVITGGEI